MVAKISTTLKKLESCNKQNRELLEEFYRYRQSLDHKSDLATNTILALLISLDRFLNGRSFLDINEKAQIIEFLEQKFEWKRGEWVKREHDAEGKWITTWNQYCIWLKTFFRWLTNRDRQDEDWETPSFLQKVKSKKPIRVSPYEDSEIWERDEILRIIKYTDTRDQAIITLMWDLDARNHEITQLRICDIILKEQYGQGKISSNTKTGGGPILLRCSFPYVRDWLNKHPFKTEPKARLICSLRNGAPIRPDAIQRVMKRLQLRIKRMVESESIALEEREKLEFLLRTKKWNPYCIRHSAIDADAAYLPEYALKNKVRWSQNSKQAVRYVRRRMNDELTSKILEHDGIKLPTRSSPILSNRTCYRCGYTNKLESKFCENFAKGCNYPLTEQAFEEIKAAEQAKMQELIDKSNIERNNMVQALQQELQSKTQEIQSLGELCKHSLELSSKQNGTISDYKGMVDDVNSRYDKLMDLYESLKSKFDTSVSTTKTALGRIDELQSIMRGGLLIKPGRRTAEELQRRAKILLQVAPDWQKRTAPVNARLTPEEEQKVMELINQSKVS